MAAPGRRLARGPLFGIALSVVLAVSSSVYLAGQTPTLTPSTGAAIVIRAGRVLDLGTGVYRQNVGILVRGDSIAEVGAFDDVRQHARDARLVDLSARTVLPGLIDTHTHLLENYDPSVGLDDTNIVLTVASMSPAARALLGAAMAREDLDAGITTVRDLGNSGVNADVALRDGIAAGYVAGPRMVVSTRALSPPGGQFPALQKQAQELVDQEYAVVVTVDEARRAVQAAFYDGADVIKAIVNNASNVLDPDVLQAIVREAHRVGKKVAAHATSELACSLAVKAGVDSIEHAYRIDDATMRAMADAKIYLVPTDPPADVIKRILDARASSGTPSGDVVQKLFEGNADRLKRAVAAGVPLAFGSDMYFAVPGMTRGEASAATLRAYAAEGVPPLQILRMATINAAALLGMGNRIGDLKPGRAADVIAVEGDPLADVASLQHVTFVMKAGLVVRDTSR